MSYESVGTTDDAPINLSGILSWTGRPKSLSKITTIREGMDYAAAGYKVCKTNGWVAAGNLYFEAFYKGLHGGFVDNLKVILQRADRAADEARNNMPRARVDLHKPIDLSPDAPPVPTQLASAGFMGMSPLMMAVAGAGFWFFVLPALKGKKGRRKARKKAKRIYRGRR